VLIPPEVSLNHGSNKWEAEWEFVILLELSSLN
jgi:hypothetical protein